MFTPSPLRTIAVVLAAVHVAGAGWGRPLLPYSGTLALAALLAYAVHAVPAGRTAWPRNALLGGLAGLTVAAALLDGRGEFFGWPSGVSFPAEDPVWAAAESAALSCAAVGCAAALFGAAGRPRSRWALGGVLAGALVVAALCHLALWEMYTDRPWAPAVFEWPRAVMATLPLTLAAVLGTLAVGAAWAAGRRTRAAGTAAAPLVAMALLGLSQLGAGEAFYRRLPPDPAAGAGYPPYLVEEWEHGYVGVITPKGAAPHLWVDVDYVGVERATAVAVRDDRGPDVSWSGDLWGADISWAATLPALAAALCLLGIVAVVGALAEDEPVLPG